MKLLIFLFFRDNESAWGKDGDNSLVDLRFPEGGGGGANPKGKGGADVNTVNQYIHTATLLTERRNHGYVDILLKSGADMNLLLGK